MDQDRLIAIAEVLVFDRGGEGACLAASGVDVEGIAAGGPGDFQRPIGGGVAGDVDLVRWYDFRQDSEAPWQRQFLVVRRNNDGDILQANPNRHTDRAAVHPQGAQDAFGLKVNLRRSLVPDVAHDAHDAPERKAEANG
jgi:hypothetical protein